MTGGGRPDGATLLFARATALTALLGGYFYTFGGVLLAGQIRATGIELRDVLPVVPIQYLLTRGLSSTLDAFALFLGLVALLVVAGLLLRPVEERLLQRERRPGKLGLGLALLGLVAIVLASTPILAPFLAVAYAALFVPLLIPRAFTILGLGVTFRRLVVAAAAVVVVGVLVNAFYTPERLPQIRVLAVAGESVTGRLIVHTANGFYLARPGASFVVIPNLHVKRAVVTSLESRARKTLFSRLWDAASS